MSDQFDTELKKNLKLFNSKKKYHEKRNKRWICFTGTLKGH